MKNDGQLRQMIIDLFNNKPILRNIATDLDFFDVGASSLTIVDLQLQVESALGVSVPTSKLMANPTIDGWVSLYAQSKAAAA